VHIVNISHEYKNFLLAVEDVELKPGKIIGLVGANGAGKSTLMSLLSGFLTSNVSFDVSEDYNPSETLFIPSEVALYEYLTVGEFVGLLVQQGTKEVTVEDVLEKLALTNKRNTLIADLSQGMKKKLTLINVFTQKYQFLILDEPFNSIDMQYIYQLKKELQMLSNEATILISSHILDTLSNLCDAFIYLKAGAVVKQFDNNDQTVLERELFE